MSSCNNGIIYALLQQSSLTALIRVSSESSSALNIMSVGVPNLKFSISLEGRGISKISLVTRYTFALRSSPSGRKLALSLLLDFYEAENKH